MSDQRRYHRLYDFTQSPPALLKTEHCRRRNVSQAFKFTLDRVNVLGENPTPGHTGCVNALSWACDGQLLLSGGDDTTVRIWSVDTANTVQEYPFICRSVIQTDHRANIFSAQMLPLSSRLATAAGDKQVRVFDVGEEGVCGLINSRETVYTTRQTCIRILKCHEDRVKRIVTEHSPDIFLSVGEDGAVRQHDLRIPHDCHSESCPTPLVKVNHELSTLSLSSLTPYQFVVAGESPYGYLFDRRQTGRILQEEWGVPFCRGKDAVTNCVRRFGRSFKDSRERGRRSNHITGARMSNYNGHEVVLAYSADAVYLFSTLDDPFDAQSVSPTSQALLLPNTHLPKEKEGILDGPRATDVMNIDDASHGASGNGIVGHDGDRRSDSGDDEEGFANFSDTDEEGYYPNVPLVHPRQRYAGARNIQTIKDVNFLGPCEEYVTSGSDDGNFFVWHKKAGTISGIYEGDGSVVNMIEGHPHLPVVAVSGIDTTIKIFAPTHGVSQFSRMGDAAQITEANNRMSRTPIYRFSIPLTTLLANARLLGRNEGGDIECRGQ